MGDMIALKHARSGEYLYVEAETKLMSVERELTTRSVFKSFYHLFGILLGTNKAEAELTLKNFEIIFVEEIREYRELR